MFPSNGSDHIVTAGTTAGLSVTVGTCDYDSVEQTRGSEMPDESPTPSTPYRIPAMVGFGLRAPDNSYGERVMLLGALVLGFVSGMARLVVAVARHETFGAEAVLALCMAIVFGSSIPDVARAVWRKRGRLGRRRARVEGQSCILHDDKLLPPRALDTRCSGA